jgi:hypothetical protein
LTYGQPMASDDGRIGRSIGGAHREPTPLALAATGTVCSKLCQPALLWRQNVLHMQLWPLKLTEELFYVFQHQGHNSVFALLLLPSCLFRHHSFHGPIRHIAGLPVVLHKTRTQHSTPRSATPRGGPIQYHHPALRWAALLGVAEPQSNWDNQRSSQTTKQRQRP